MLVLIGTVLAAGLLHVASTEPGAPLPTLGRRLGSVEWTLVLGGVVALFTLFAVAQVVAVSDGGHRVLATEGLTYAEYARRGYFQLLAVAGLTAALLVGLGAVADRSTPASQRRFVVLSCVAVGLTLVVLGVAMRRLGLYEDAYGWTMLRLMVKASAVWLGLSFVLLGLRLAGVGADRAWLLPAVTAVALAIALVLNVVDPEAMVARHNLARARAGEQVDPVYLGQLSDDAVPTVVAGLDSLSPADRRAARYGICDAGEPEGGIHWNRAADRAADARARLCP